MVALAHCPKAAPLLELFVQVMLVAMRRYPGPGPDRPVIRGSEIKAQFQLDGVTYGKVSTLVSDEGWFFNGGGGTADGDWHRFIRAEILHLKGVTDIQSYLDVLARYRFGPPEIEIPVHPEEPHGLLRRPVEWLSKRELSALDLIVIAVIGGLIVALVVWVLFS